MPAKAFICIRPTQVPRLQALIMFGNSGMGTVLLPNPFLIFIKYQARLGLALKCIMADVSIRSLIRLQYIYLLQELLFIKKRLFMASSIQENPTILILSALAILINTRSAALRVCPIPIMVLNGQPASPLKP